MVIDQESHTRSTQKIYMIRLSTYRSGLEPAKLLGETNVPPHCERLLPPAHLLAF